MTKKETHKHTYLHFVARHKLKFKKSKRFSANLELKNLSKRFVKNLINRIAPKSLPDHLLDASRSNTMQLLCLIEQPSTPWPEKKSFFDTNLSQVQSSLPSSLAACLASLDIAQPLFFSSSFMVGYRVTERGLRLHHYSSENFSTSVNLWKTVYNTDGNYLTEEVWEKAKNIYNGIQKISVESHPRLHQALRFYTRALVEDFFDYCYLNEYLVLESLFNATPNEITHKMAERVAVISNSKDPMSAFKSVKDISKFRNQVAHGFRKSKSTRKDALKNLGSLSNLNRVLLSRILVSPDLRDIWTAKKDNELEERLIERIIT